MISQPGSGWEALRRHVRWITRASRPADASPGAGWDIDRAQPKRVTAAAMIIDLGWIPGLPQLSDKGGLLDGLLPGIGLDRGH
nr:hypothetical protein C5F59_38605 [Streptomyces sp. QL37]